jgi:O-antigen/teichoic acid export membrane protein
MTSGSNNDLGFAAQAGAKKLFLRYGLGFLINIAGTVIIARRGGPELWGLFAISQVVLNVFVVLSQGCWAFLIQNRTPPTREEVGNCYSLQAMISGLWALLVLCLSPAIARHLSSNELFPLLLGTVFGGFFYGWRYVVCGLSERDLQYNVSAVTELSDILVFNGIAVAGTLAGHPYAGILAGNFLRGVVSGMFALSMTRNKLYFRFSCDMIRRIAQFSLPYSGFAALQWLPIYAGPVVAGMFLGVRELGLLQLAYKTMEYPRVLVTISSRISMSFFSRLGTQADEVLSGVVKTLDNLIYFLVPAMGLIAALGPVWIPMVYGSPWLQMSDVMLMILYPHLVMAMMMILTALLSARGNSRSSFVFYGVYNVVYWSAVIIVTPRLLFFGLPVTEWIALIGCVVLLKELRSIGVSSGILARYGALLMAATIGAALLHAVALHRTPLETSMVGFIITGLWFAFSPARKEMVQWMRR